MKIEEENGRRRGVLGCRLYLCRGIKGAKGRVVIVLKRIDRMMDDDTTNPLLLFLCTSILRRRPSSLLRAFLSPPLSSLITHAMTPRSTPLCFRLAMIPLVERDDAITFHAAAGFFAVSARILALSSSRGRDLTTTRR